MNTKPIIGILSGMESRSTSIFLDQVIDKCITLYGAKNDIDFPCITIISLPTPFYVNQPIDEQAMVLALKDGIVILKNLVFK